MREGLTMVRSTTLPAKTTAATAGATTTASTTLPATTTAATAGATTTAASAGATTAPAPASSPAPTRARRSVRELPLTERPRERLVAHGAAGLSSAELIGLVWASGSRQASATTMAEEALVRSEGLRGLAAASPRELERLPGIGPARAAQLTAAFELGRRAVSEWPSRRWMVRSPRDLAPRLSVEMGHLEREELRVVLLDTRNGVLATPTVYRGNVSVALVRVGELFRDAVRLHAARIILAHNHPSGDPTPSPDDLHMTAEAVAAGRLLDIAVLDHLVIGHGTWLSLRDRGVAFEHH